MRKNITNKYRKRKNPTCNRAAYAQRIRRYNEMFAKKERSKEIPQNNNEALESTNDLPIISDVYETDHFVGELPSPMQPFEGNEIDLGTDTVIIKSEVCEEENNLHNVIDKSESENAPETLGQLHQTNNKIPYNSGYLHEEKPDVTYDKENELLLKVLKYLGEISKNDKFDLGGKLYAAKLRSVPFKNQQKLAENLCRKVLVEVEHFKDGQFILSKFHISDYLRNFNTATNVSNENDFVESGSLDPEKKDLLQNIENCLTQNIRKNQFDIFADFYATKMRSFSSIQYYHAEKLISKIILEAELGRLRQNCKQMKNGNHPLQTFVSGKLPASNVTFVENKTQLTQSNKQLMHSSFIPSSSSRTPTQKKAYSPKKKNVSRTIKQLINDPVNKKLNNSLSKTLSIKKEASLQKDVQKFSESSAQNQTRTEQSGNDPITRDSGNAKNSSFVPIPNILHQLPTNTLIKVVYLNKSLHIS